MTKFTLALFLLVCSQELILHSLNLGLQSSAPINEGQTMLYLTRATDNVFL